MNIHILRYPRYTDLKSVRRSDWRPCLCVCLRRRSRSNLRRERLLCSLWKADPTRRRSSDDAEAVGEGVGCEEEPHSQSRVGLEHLLRLSDQHREAVFSLLSTKKLIEMNRNDVVCEDICSHMFT